MINALHNKRFLFVTGKGGTGKTTVAAALALHLASQGKRVLLALCQAKERVSLLLGGPPVGNTILELRPNISAVNMDPDAALEEYGRMVLRIRTLYRAVFGNQLVRSFFRATPGLNEWAMLGKAWFHTTEKRPDSSFRFDTVILDAPATGHGLDMLRGPKVIVDVVPPGLLRREATRAWKLFSDPNRAGLVVVTLPEEMPVTETFDLLTTIREELKLPVAQLVVNGVLPLLLSDQERIDLLGLHDLQPSLPGSEALAAGARRARRESIQLQNLERLRTETQIPLTFLPQLFEEAESESAIQTLAARFETQESRN